MVHKFLKRLAAAAIIATAPLSASAITLIETTTATGVAGSGTSFDVTAGDTLTFIGFEVGSGPQVFDIAFTTTDVVPLIATATTTLINGLTIGFSFNPNSQVPTVLTATFNGAEVGDSGLFEVAFAAIPLPAGALLLLTGLGGFALLRRRQTGALAA